MRIKDILKEKGLTQQELADISGVSRQYICDIENNNRNKHITIAILGRIADAMDLNIVEFFIEEDELRMEVRSVIDVFNHNKETVNS